ncbi:hypothetical protein VYU27_002385 [Nannochloropsis oceanica]
MFASGTRRSVSRLVATCAHRCSRSSQTWITGVARGLIGEIGTKNSITGHFRGTGAVVLLPSREQPPRIQQYRASSMSALEEPPYDYVSSTPSSTPSPPPAASAPSGGGKIMPFLLADIGEGIAEVELMQWFVQEGESIKQFDRVCEVQSDKATVEISSRYDGVVSRVHHPVGAVVKVGSALIDIEVARPNNHTAAATLAAAPTMNNADLPSPAMMAAAAPVTSPPLLPTVSLQQQPQHHLPQHKQSERASNINREGNRGDIVPATPAVRRWAKEYGVDLAFVRATGPQGRVLKGDVLNHISTRNGGGGIGMLATTASTSTPAATAATAAAAAAAAAVAPSSPSFQLNGAATAMKASSSSSPSSSTNPPHSSPLSALHLTASQRVPIRGVMRQMVKSMNASLKIPHFGYQDEVCMDKAAAFRSSLRPLAEEQGLKFTYLPLMLKAASLALLRFPILNASLSEDEKEVVYHSSHEIGVAMATSKGLIVPVLRKVQEKSLMEIARELAVFQCKAEGQGGREGGQGGFKEEDFQGATFSLSNIGSLGGTYMDAKIVPPQVAIGAVGRIQMLPRYVQASEGEVGREGGPVVMPVRVMAISWAGDHRVVDGATMAKFSNLWKKYLEEPALMLAETR